MGSEQQRASWLTRTVAILQAFWKVVRQRIAYSIARMPRWQRVLACLLVFLVLFGTLFQIAFGISEAAGSRSGTTTYVGTPNHYHPSTPVTGFPSGPRPGPKPVISGKPNPAAGAIRHTFTPTMKPLILPLSATAPTHAISSDGVIDISVPTGVVTAADITINGGSMQLAVYEVAGPMGSIDGGSSDGTISFGTYLFQLQNAQGHELAGGQGLRQPIALTYHWLGKSAPVPFTLDPMIFTLNPALPSALPIQASHFGSTKAYPLAYHAASRTLTGNILLPSSSNGGGFNAPSPIGYAGQPNTFQTDLHTGGLIDSIPIGVPSGPGGLTPAFDLNYDSNAVSGMHGAQATSSWVGMGWNLDPGEITWTESQDPTIANGSDHGWRSSWSLVDANGSSVALIPPNTGISTYYDDTPNNPATGLVTWHSAPDNHVVIDSYPNPTVNCTNFPNSSCPGGGNYAVQPPCWRVWLPNGDMEEFGCTTDSLEWYPAGPSGTTNYVFGWKLDLITDPSGNQIHFHYLRDTTTHNGIVYTRDTVLNDVSWDSPGCLNANTACSTWTPLMEVVFHYAKAVATVAPGATVCTQSGSYRCDDPQGSSQISTPLVTNTEVLNSITTEVRTSTSGSWDYLNTYKLYYAQGTGKSITDPFTGDSMDIAGYLLLEQLTVTGDDGTTVAPTQTFSYSTGSAYTQYYEDAYYPPTGNAGCGPVWNTGNGSGCRMWSQSYYPNYMTGATNGMGLTWFFSWEDMRTNQHGVDSGQNALDPGYCTRAQNANGSNTGYPCDEADDEGWSHMTLTSRAATWVTPNASDTHGQTEAIWNYVYNLANLTAQECSDCAVGMYWGDANDGDASDFYNGSFTGFAFAEALNPDGSLVNNYYYSTEGWGLWKSSITCRDGQSTCPADPSWDLTNAASGRAYQVDTFNPEQGSTWPLQTRVLTTYTAACPAYTLSPSQSGNWNNNVVAELDQENPVVVCDINTTETQIYHADGVNSPSSSTVPLAQTVYTYATSNDYGQLTQVTTTGNDLSTTPTITDATTYIWDASITYPGSSNTPTGTYIVATPVFSAVEDGSGVQQQCAYTLYDSASSYLSGSQSSLTKGLATQTDTYATCPSSWTTTNAIATTASYNANGDPQAGKDPDANSGISGHTTSACTFSSVAYTSCLSYDGIYGALPATATNALDQTGTTSYNTTVGFGYGTWPASITDANGQTTSYSYDGLGRQTQVIEPGDSTNDPTVAYTYSYSTCATATVPCVEVDTNQKLGTGSHVTSEAFYDGWGNLVETRTPAPGGQDAIQFNLYDSTTRKVYVSQPLYVSSGTGYALPPAPSSMVGTSYSYDGLGRITEVVEPNSATSTASYAPNCNVSGTGDTDCWSVATSIDPNSHQSTIVADALGRERYTQDFTGSNPYTFYRITKYWYDYLGDLASVSLPDTLHTSTATYNSLGEMTALSDPDYGTNASYSYDPNGNQTTSTSPRASVYTCYDGLNRVTAISATNSACASPLASSTYDSTSGGNDGVGRLTGETFASGPTQNMTGSYAYTYDARGRQTGWSMTIGGTTYPFSFTYNQANQPVTTTYPDGDLVTTSYGAQDWLSGITEKLGSNQTTLLGSISYSGTAGAAGSITGASVGPYTWSLAYDLNLRLDGETVTNGSTTEFSEQRAFDNLGNVTLVNRYLNGAGNDHQAFCYDEQNRLIWAGSTGTPPCNVTAPTGTFAAAQYTQSYAYDVMDRLTTGPAGTYTYGDSNHLDAVTSTSSSYTAAYDFAGSMKCRAPTSSQTCSGTPTGQSLSYDAEERLLTWQNAQSSPTSSASYAYDGEGHRVEQQVTTSGTTTTTYYIGSYEEVSVTGSTTTTSKYYPAGLTTAVSVTGTISYLIQDEQGSVDEALSSSGSVTAAQIFFPYGAMRYQSGTMPTSYGYTGQRADPSGLLYYGARYYDPTVGQFTSVDTVQGPNRYAYVGGNPTTMTDPSGHGDGSGQEYLDEGGMLMEEAPSTEENGSDEVFGLAMDPSVEPAYQPVLSSEQIADDQLLGQAEDNTLGHTIDLNNPGYTPTPEADTNVSTEQEAQVEKEQQVEKTDQTQQTDPQKPTDPNTQQTNTNNPSKAYRALRPDEQPGNGLQAKDPNATRSVQDHVLNGSKPGYTSQYISASRNLTIAERWSTGRIAVIDLTKINGIVIDISTPQGLAAQNIYYPSMAYSFAISSQEVLIVGTIPGEAIIEIIYLP